MPIGFHPCSSVFTRGFPVPTGLSGLRSNPLEFGYFPPRPRPARPRVVPEARKILAGGAVQRNHRTHRPQPNFAPRRGARTVIARHSRSAPRRVLRRSVFPADARPRGCQGDGRPAHEEASPWCGAATRLRGARAPPGRSAPRFGFSGGSAALHHRLIFCVPPARREREAGNAAGTERICPNSSVRLEACPTWPGRGADAPAYSPG